MRAVNNQTGRHELNSHDKPVWRKSFTTSCVDGTSPSTPPPCFNSNEPTKARAAAQLKMAPHLILHTCSARLFRMGGSDLAFALAKRDKNLRVSSDQRPPISPARTTRRALRRGPTNSGNVRSFNRLAAAKTHHPHLPRVDEGTRRSAKETPVSCQLPVGSSKERKPINRIRWLGRGTNGRIALAPGIWCKRLTLWPCARGRTPRSRQR